eukprot:scaffold3426_cov41-Prasinocladus_malaysianus.AAC.2
MAQLKNDAAEALSPDSHNRRAQLERDVRNNRQARQILLSCLSTFDGCWATSSGQLLSVSALSSSGCRCGCFTWAATRDGLKMTYISRTFFRQRHADSFTVSCLDHSIRSTGAP